MGNKAKKITIGVLAAILLVGAVCAGLYTLDVFKDPEEIVVIEPATDDAVEKAKNVTDETTLRELLSQNCELDIQVTENLEITETLVVNGVKKVTGDVTLKAGYELGSGVVMLDVAKGATLTINGWNIDGNGIATGIHVSRNATLNHVAGNMEYMGTYGVTSEGTANLSDKTSIAHVGEGAVKVSIEGTANITGGTYKDAGKYMVNVERGAALNVSGEPYFDTAVEQLVYNYGETKITGGTFLNSGYRGISNYAKITMEYQGNKEDGRIEVGNTGNVAVYTSSSFKVSFKGIYGHDTGGNVFLQSSTQSVCKVENCLFENSVGNTVSIRGSVSLKDVEVRNSEISGILLQQNGVATFENIKVDNTKGRGINVESATLKGKNIEVSNTAGVGIAGQTYENIGPTKVELSGVKLHDIKGNNIKVVNGATMSIKNSTFEKSKRTSVFASKGSITLSGVQILGTLDSDVNVIQVDPKGEVTISGKTLITGGIKRAVAVYGGKFVMNGGVIKDNSVTETGAGVHVTVLNDDIGTFIMNGGSICNNVTADKTKNAGGVNVSNDAVFIMNGGKIYNNTTSGIGGGVRVVEGATFQMNGGSIYGNASTQGGGVYLASKATFTMTGGSIYQNQTKTSGAGLFVLGTFELKGGEIYQNVATTYGGAMNIASSTNKKNEVTAAGSLIMTGGSLYGNSAVSGGGAVQVSANTTAKFSGGSIKDNDTDGMGDGIRVSGKVTISDKFYMGNDKVALTSKDVKLKITGSKLAQHNKKDPLLVAVADGVATGHVAVECDNQKSAAALLECAASGNGSYLFEQKDKNLVVNYAAADMDMTGADTVYVSDFKQLKEAVTGTKDKRYIVLGADVQMESTITVPNGTTVYIRDDGTKRTLSRKSGVTAAFFNTRYGTGLYLVGTQNGNLVLNGELSEDAKAASVKSLVTAKGGTYIEGVTFVNNGSKENTGLNGIFVYQTYGHVDVYKSSFSGAQGNSGAIGIAGMATGYVENSEFKDNSVRSGGGAIRLEKNATLTAVNSTFENNEAGTSGGAIISESGTFTAIECNFKNNTAYNDGGVIKSNGGTAKFLNEDETEHLMSNNSCGLHGGAIWAKGSLTVEKYSLEGNKAGTRSSANGGGIYLEGTTTVAAISDSMFKENESLTNCGGAVCNGGATLTILNSDFEANKTTKANKNGGAVYSNNDKAVTTIEESTFTDNQAKDGGAIRVTAGTIDVKRCTFTNNSAKENGGAINTAPINENANVKVTVEGGTFTGNHAVSGGAIFNGLSGENASSVETKNVLFEGNYTKGNTAGAVYVEATYIDHGSKFKENKACDGNGQLNKNGGALYLQNNFSKATLTNTTFEGNQASVGGAIMITAGTIQADSCDFINNTCVGSDGGAICMSSDKGKINVTLTGNEEGTSKFEGNKAEWNGGAIRVYGSNHDSILKVTGYTFKNNTVNANIKSTAGAISVSGKGCITTDSTANIFIGNEAKNGGAVYYDASNELCANNWKFEQNSASENGGALYIKTGKATLNGNSVFRENTATGHGGAIFSTTRDDVVIINTEFNQNRVVGKSDSLPGKGGAVYIDKTSTQGVTITESKFNENRAAADGGAVFHNDGKLTVTDCDFTNNSAATSYSVSPKPNGFRQSAGNGGAIYIRGTASALITATQTDSHKFTGNTAYRGGNGYIWGAIANNSTGDVRYSAKYVFEENTHENQGQKGNGCGIQDATKVLIRMDEADSYKALDTAVKNAGTKQTVEIKLLGDIEMGSPRINVVSGQKVIITNDKSKDVVISRTKSSDNNMFNVDAGGSLKFVKNADGGSLTFDGKNIARASMLYGRGELIVDGIVMKNGKSGNGSAIQLRTDKAKLCVKNTVFEDNFSTGNGGAISLIKENSTCPAAEIGNTVFKGNKTTVGDNTSRYGGAIYMEGGSITSTGTIDFENNQATIGGAIYMNAGTVTLVHGGKFNNNMAGATTKDLGRAGAVDVITGTFTVKGYEFTGNKAVKDAGAIRVDVGTANVENCNFTDNSAGTTKEVTGSSIYNGRGGAIYVSAGGKGVLNLLGKGTFSGNTYTHANTGTVKNAIYKASGTFNNNGTYEFKDNSVEP